MWWGGKLKKVLNIDLRSSLLIASLVFVLLVFLRAGNRLLLPEVWNEDGPRNLAAYISDGWSSILEPVNGYIILIPKLITAVSASISLANYPLISVVVAWAFTIFVLLVVSRKSLQLKGGILLGVACILVPTRPETLGIPLYTFWWGALLLFIFIFWEETPKNIWFRSIFIGLASLSSPVCIVTLPLFWGKVLIAKNKRPELIIALTATVFTAIQVAFMMDTHRDPSQFELGALVQTIPVFLGSYTIGVLLPSLQWISGVLIAVFISICLFRQKEKPVVWALAYLWVASTLLSVARVDIAALNPALTGERYFFFPYIVLSWFLIHIFFSDVSKFIRYIALGCFALSIINMLPVLTRTHDNLHWKQHVKSCGQFDGDYYLPVQFDGVSARAWSMKVAAEDCRRMAGDTGQSSTSATFPYRTVDVLQFIDLETTEILKSQSIVENNISGFDYSTAISGISSLPAGYSVIGSFVGSDADTGDITLKMKRGDKVIYRSEASDEIQKIVVLNHEKQFLQSVPASNHWTVIEFSNRNLPDEFEVQFLDTGDGSGQWFALGLKSDSEN